MHDPMTQAFEIRQFWRRKNKWGYRPSFITIWHVDPERGGSDDSCDWFGRRMTDREHEWAKSLIENEYDNLRTYFSQWIKLEHGTDKRVCDDPDDCYCGEHVETCTREEMVTRVLQIGSCYKRSFRRFRWHPRWHFWHWKIQIHPLQIFKRWAFSRCCKCGGRFTWGYSPVSGSWYGTGPRWFRSEKNVMHSDCSGTTVQQPAGVTNASS